MHEDISETLLFLSDGALSQGQALGLCMFLPLAIV